MTKRYWVGTSVLIIVVLALFTSCRMRRSAGDSSEVKGFVVPKDHRWPSPTAEVCWKTPGYLAEKAIIKGALIREFNQRTAFKFTGFEDCGFFTSDKLAVRLDSSGHPQMGLGYHGRSADNVMFVPPFNSQFSGCQASAAHTTICLHNVGLHEFAHAIGLAHEQDRSDSTCNRHTGQGRIKDQIEIGNYDHDSVMDACRPNLYTRIIGLSAGDLASIAYLYGPAPKASSTAGQSVASITTSAQEQEETSSNGQFRNKCQPCGEERTKNSYCGIWDTSRHTWRSGQWLRCIPPDDRYRLRCDRCGVPQRGKRFCGTLDERSYSYVKIGPLRGVWVDCVTGSSSVTQTENTQNEVQQKNHASSDRQQRNQISSSTQQEDATSSAESLINKCRVCGEQRPKSRYCGVLNSAKNTWKSGQWVPCLVDDARYRLSCGPCGKGLAGQRYCGTVERSSNTYITVGPLHGVWVKCVK